MSGSTIVATSTDWKLNFISEGSKGVFLGWIEKVKELTESVSQAGSAQERIDLLNTLKQILMTIRDRTIGNGCCKYFFVRHGLLQALSPLLWMKDESSAEFTRLLMDCQRDALTLLSVLIAQSGEVITLSGEVELFSNLLMLLRSSSAQEVKFLEILTRSLSSFARKVEGVRGAIFEAQTLSILLAFLENPNRAVYSSAVIQNVCSILAAGCNGEGKSRLLLSSKILPQLLSLLTGSVCLTGTTTTGVVGEASIRIGVTDLKTLDGSIELLGTLTRDCPEACEAVCSAPVAGRRVPNILFSLLNVSLLSTELKLKFSILLIQLYRSCSSGKAFSGEMKTGLLSFLVSLIDACDEHSLRASYLLGNQFGECFTLYCNHILFLFYLMNTNAAYAVAEDDALQSCAIQMNVIAATLKMLTKARTMDSVYYERVLESALLATSALSATSEECRKCVVESKILSVLVEALSSESTAVKIAACQCARGLSRSVKNLRTNLFDAGISKPLLKLLNDPSIAVQTTACATLCNMVLEFTALKKIIVNEGGIADLVRLIIHPDVSLKVNAIWSLKNLLYHSDNEIRGKVLSLLSFETISGLLEEPNEQIQEQTLNLVRNIGCGKQENIEEIFKGFGTGRLIQILESKLQSPHPAIVLQTLYIIVNVATGTELHKSRIMESSLMIQCILSNLTNENAKIRLAAVWSLINLTWPNEPGFTERANFLIQIGALKILKSLLNDPDYDVRQKVTCAVANFSSSQ